MHHNDSPTQHETQCRERLFADPADIPARLALAWSLLLQACHCENEAEIRSNCAVGQEPERALLKESLMQAAVAALLSPKAAERREAARIADKAREIGASEMADEAARESQAMHRQLAAAVRR